MELGGKGDKEAVSSNGQRVASSTLELATTVPAAASRHLTTHLPAPEEACM
jgi:hypothetical protein